jgi:hypothetical protein
MIYFVCILPNKKDVRTQNHVKTNILLNRKGSLQKLLKIYHIYEHTHTHTHTHTQTHTPQRKMFGRKGTKVSITLDNGNKNGCF